MKKLFIIMLALCFAVCLHAQIPTEKTLIADETWVVASGKTGFRIICSNDKISQIIMQKFEQKEMTKFTYTKKKDRKGDYWERSFYFKKDSWNDVIGYLKQHLK